MARIFISGFETGDRGPWTSYSNDGNVSLQTPPTGMTGSYALLINAMWTSYMQKDFASNLTALYMSFRYRFTSTSGWTILEFRDSGGTVVASLTRNTSTKYLEVRLGSFGGSVLDTGTIALEINTTYLIELRIVPLNTSGIIQVKVDGSAVDIDYSGDTTYGLENIKSLRLVGGESGNGNYFDDLVIDDADWIGNSRIQAIYPTGAGTTTQWDPSTGDNYACVDERPANDFDYVGTNVADEVDTYAASNLSGIITEIKCVQVIARATKEGSPTPTQLQLAVRSGGTNYFSATKALPTSFGEDVFAIWETNPADSAAWEEADVNAVEIGVKSIT